MADYLYSIVIQANSFPNNMADKMVWRINRGYSLYIHGHVQMYYRSVVCLLTCNNVHFQHIQTRAPTFEALGIVRTGGGIFFRRPKDAVIIGWECHKYRKYSYPYLLIHMLLENLRIFHSAFNHFIILSFHLHYYVLVV